MIYISVFVLRVNSPCCYFPHTEPEVADKTCEGGSLHGRQQLSSYVPPPVYAQ